MREIFINEFGRLRSGWRTLIFVAAFIALIFLITSVLRVIFIFIGPSGSSNAAQFIAELIFRFGLLASALGAGYFCARYLEGLPWRSLGLTFHSGWLRDLVFGFVIGFASLVLAVGIASKGFKFLLGDTGWSSIVRSMIGSGVLLFVAALQRGARKSGLC